MTDKQPTLQALNTKKKKLMDELRKRQRTIAGTRRGSSAHTQATAEAQKLIAQLREISTKISDQLEKNKRGETK